MELLKNINFLEIIHEDKILRGYQPVQVKHTLKTIYVLLEMSKFIGFAPVHKNMIVVLDMIDQKIINYLPLSDALMVIDMTILELKKDTIILASMPISNKSVLVVSVLDYDPKEERVGGWKCSVSRKVKPKIKVDDSVDIDIYPMYQTYVDKDNYFQQDSESQQTVFYLRLKTYQNHYSNFILDIQKKQVKFIDNRPLVDDLLFAIDKYKSFVFVCYQQVKKLKIERFDYEKEKNVIKFLDAYQKAEILPKEVDIATLVLKPQLRQLAFYGRCYDVELMERKTEGKVFAKALFAE